MPPTYYEKLTTDYTRRRSILLPYLHDAGFKFTEPRGAYYVLTDISDFGAENDVAFVQKLVQEIGVAGVPGSSFYRPASDGRQKVRFMWAKKDQTLHDAGQRLLKLTARQ